MDKGAHFYKCDFQVHTPRDPNWSGNGAVSDVERKQYAEELVLACRQKGLGAIAITDHHDFVFFPYVRAAAASELTESGQPIPHGRELVVFPGLELTLTAPNCQALLILDADFPENLLASVLTALAINPAPAADARVTQVVRIPQNVVNDLKDLYEKLNAHAQLKDRFAVLPNVTDGGYGTLLRTGFANFYKNMPCVGAYTDGPVSRLGEGKQQIVRGENRDYGFRAVAVFQTSDNRRRDHANLGTHATWVKWSEPTAEALRQACLAKESRLSQTEPELPNLWIASISVSNSKFLGRVDVDFNRQYNAVIGGRGTGKSTLLEYLRWGLCDQPIDDADSETATVQTRRKKLIDDTLQRFDGEVIITFFLNEVRHVLKRSSKTQEILLRIGDAAFVPTTEQEVRNLFSIQGYSQKQLSNIGVRLDELTRFVELPIKQSLDQIRSDVRATEAKLRSAYGNVIRKREIEAEGAKYTIEINSLTEQLTKLRQALKGLSATDQAVVDRKPLFDNEDAIVESLGNDLHAAEDLVRGLKRDFEQRVESDDMELETHNENVIRDIRAKYAAKMRETSKQIDLLVSLFEGSGLREIDQEVAKWQALKADFDRKYEAAKKAATANEQQLGQIRDVEKRIAEIKKLQLANRNALAALGDPDASHTALRATWNGLHAQALQILEEQCATFSALSDQLIKADVRGNIDTDVLRQRIKAAFASRNIKEQKIDDLCQCIATAADPVVTWNDILVEIEQLAVHDASGAQPLPATPMMDRCGFIDSEKKRLAGGLDAKRWLDLSVSSLQFNPRFLYCTNRDTAEYIEFGDASAGQQATALLSVLLNQGGGPLVIDQPEDDLDSKMSPEIVRQIWKAKSSRQLIFASHNANFVVNGDAELVICCDYVKAGDQTGGRIKDAGAIDKVQIKDEITTVTEGGKDAFKLRKEKYGF